MNCNEARKYVSQFVDDELNIREADQFLRHIETCAECRDELDIYYTMSKALELIDSNEHQTFDFRKMLGTQIHSVKRRIHRIRRLHFVRRFMIIIMEIFLLLAAYMSVAQKAGFDHRHFHSFLELNHPEEQMQEESTDG